MNENIFPTPIFNGKSMYNGGGNNNGNNHKKGGLSV